MSQRIFKTSPTPEVRILSIGGNLTLKGWEADEVSFKGSAGDQVDFDQTADSLSLTCEGDCLLRLPVNASVSIDRVHGEARLKLLEEPVSINSVDGSLVASYCGPLQVGRVSGELIAKHISGDLQIEEVDGNVILKEVEGWARLDRVSGNLEAREVRGNLHATVDGNARLRLSNLEGDEVQVSAEGNLECRLSLDASAQVQLSSGAERIQVSGPEGRMVIQERAYSLTLGEGEARVFLSAEGNLSISSEEEDWDETGGVPDPEFSAQIAEQIGRQVEAQMQALTRQLEEQMAHLSSVAGRAGVSAERMEQIMQRARETSERATARAQEKMRKAQEKLARKMENEQRKAEARARAAERRGARSFGIHVSTSGGAGASVPASEPVSEEERMLILRMLEEKKITLDEAERLLSALEGKDS